jgi:hypothetical protein
MRSILKSFLKGSTWKFTWNGLKIPYIGIYSGLFQITWFLVVGCTRSIPSQYRWRLAKDWERPSKRAITAIIMYSDKTLFTKRKVVSQVKNQMIIEVWGDWFVVKHGVSMHQVNPNKASKENTTIICSHLIKTTHDSFKGTLSNLSHLRQVMLQQKLLNI